MRRRIAKAVCLLIAPSLLQGCVAAVIPAIAASGIVRSQAVRRGGNARHAKSSNAQLALAGTSATLTTLKALPAPAGTPVEPTMRFVNHALMAAAAGAVPAHSMVLTPNSPLEKAAFMPCAAGQPLAVAIDADLASTPRIAEGLRRLRAFSVEVLWIADAGEVDGLRAALTKNGAWTNGDAPILTTGVGAERKELVRREAMRAFCVVAVAGARRSDVEELYAYLRNPAAALPLEPYWDAGWFVLPAGGMGN